MQVLFVAYFATAIIRDAYWKNARRYLKATEVKPIV
jgi:hypothetical protein